MAEMEPDRKTAERAIREAYESNPGGWAEHSRYVAEACKNIASRCKGLSGEKAYVLGLLGTAIVRQEAGKRRRRFVFPMRL